MSENVELVRRAYALLADLTDLDPNDAGRPPRRHRVAAANADLAGPRRDACRLPRPPRAGRPLCPRRPPADARAADRGAHQAGCGGGRLSERWIVASPG